MTTPRDHVTNVLVVFATFASAVKAREIQVLTERVHAFDEEHTVIVALQHTSECVQTHVLRNMIPYSVRMWTFESELDDLDKNEINTLVTVLGFPDP